MKINYRGVQQWRYEILLFFSSQNRVPKFLGVTRNYKFRENKRIKQILIYNSIIYYRYYRGVQQWLVVRISRRTHDSGRSTSQVGGSTFSSKLIVISTNLFYSFLKYIPSFAPENPRNKISKIVVNEQLKFLKSHLNQLIYMQ